MFSILIVEDSPEKLANLVQVLCAVPNVSLGGIEVSATSYDAKVLLTQRNFDLLILDISIPARIGESPSTDEGIKFLEEITSRDKFNVPRSIVGLTAYEDLYQEKKL